MKISNFLKLKNVFINRASENKNDFLKNLVHDFSANLGLTADKESELLHGILDREETTSTGIGNEIAIPHCRKDILDSTHICCAIVPDGLDFHSLDGKPAKIVFLTFSQSQNAKQYMQILAHLSRLLASKKFRDQLLAAKNSQELIDIFKNVEGENIIENKKKENFLVGLVLGDEEYEKDSINAFVESGILNAQVIETASIANKLQFSIPLFGSFGFGKSQEKFTKTIFGFSDDDLAVKSIYKILKESDYDIEKPGAGTIFSVKLENIIGGNPEDIDI